MAASEKFRLVLIEMLTIVLSTFWIVLGYPLLFMVLSTCWINKHLAMKLAQKDHKIRKILTGLDDILAGPDPYADPHIVLMPYFSLTDKLDVPTVIKILNEKVIEPKLYPELTQKIVQKFGYNFWYSVDNFKVENHVHYLKPECPNVSVNRSELNEILTYKLGKLPFDSTLSPWEIWVVPNLVDDRDPKVRSVFILRVNHCLMDGFSIANFLQKVSSKPWNKLDGQQLEAKQNHCAELCKFVRLFFVGPYHLLKLLAFANDTHQFVQNTYKSDLQDLRNSQCTTAIPGSRLKSIKDAYKVTMSSLITTLFGQATWKSMKRAGIPVTSTIHGLLSLPLPGHKDILTNHCALVRIPVKIDEDDPRKTLVYVERELQSLKNTVEPLLIFYTNKLIALIPLWLRTNSKSIIPSTFALTNFPGPSEPSDIFGCKGTHIGLGGKLSRGISFFHGSFSLAGQFWFQGGGPICNLPTHRDADFLFESIMDTLDDLEARISHDFKQK